MSLPAPATACYGFPLKYAAVCAKCDNIIGEGEWAYTANEKVYHVGRCPRQIEPCTECNLQHVGECF
jgi:hypothetical protein